MNDFYARRKRWTLFTLLFCASTFSNSALADTPRAERKAIMLAAQQKLETMKLEDKAKKEGEQYVSFELPNHEGKNVSSQDLLAKGPIVLAFYRGGWCPYCNKQMASYQQHLGAIQRLGAQLVAVSPETPRSAQDTVTKSELAFPVLSDKNNVLARKYGLVFQLDEPLKKLYLEMGLDLEKNQENDDWELPIPATYVIDQAGKIHYAFINVDYKQRASAKDLIAALKKLKEDP